MSARLLPQCSPGAWAIDSGPHHQTVTITVPHQAAHAVDATATGGPERAANDAFARRRSGRAALVLALVLLAVAGIVTALLLAHGVPDAWWPHTGHAFTPRGTTAQHNACDLIAGPARAYCQKTDPSHPADLAHHGISPTGLLLLIPVVIGIVFLLSLHRRQA
ncbi:hypothetical protein [Streptomyces sp. NPDC001450]